MLPGPRCGSLRRRGVSRARLTGVEAGGPSPRLKPLPRVKLRAAAGEERTARLQRETSFRSACCAEGTEVAGRGPGALVGLHPVGQQRSEAGEAGSALDRAGPAHEFSIWPGRGTEKTGWRRRPRAQRGPSVTPKKRGN
ncbi:hypothetical protein NDU88_010492 [Pleurodeles waltl]|uniref:Uncharacterized protein n=1 Tax=Pleurodeles waltl TaxID=8319 RepID=A0AAV7QYF4_PLEWA|nr:hypothetical protein NDU88_010492 [Pleurodeles waltl]